MSRDVPFRLLGLVLAVGFVLGVVALSHVPWTAGDTSRAHLRLSWRVRAVRVETCRERREEELAALPVHMRTETVCEGTVLPYTLVAVLDGDTVLTDTIRAAGARNDRPLYVNASRAVRPGRHDVSVRFARPEADSATESQALTPAVLAFRSTVRLGAGEVVLITYDADRRRLTARGHGTR